jgi:hypothetical protein
MVKGVVSGKSPERLMPLAREAALTSLRLDAGLAEAHRRLPSGERSATIPFEIGLHAAFDLIRENAR